MPWEGLKGTAARSQDSDAPRLVQTACERCDARPVKQQGQVRGDAANVQEPELRQHPSYPWQVAPCGAPDGIL